MSAKDSGSDGIALSEKRLLAYLRRITADPRLDYREQPRQIALGTEARLLKFSLRAALPEFCRPLVLRLFLAEADPVQASIEHAAQNAVAEQGFPAPRVLASSRDSSELGRPCLIMEHVEARPTSLGRLVSPRLERRLERGRRMQTLARLHELASQPLVDAFRLQGLSPERLAASARFDAASAQIEVWGLDGFRPLMRWLEMNRPPRPGSSICHGDPHPYNFIFARGRLASVVDWGGVRLGHPEMDLGVLCGLIRCAGTHTMPGGGQRVIDSHLALYRRHRPASQALVRYNEVEFLVSALVDIADREMRRAAGQTPPANAILDDPMTLRRVTTWLEHFVGREVWSSDVSR